MDLKAKKLIITKDIRQHFVPQFYLKNFGDQIYVFDKTTKNKFKTTPKRVAFQINFYGGEIKGIPFEKTLAEIEAKHASSLKKLISKKNYYSLNNRDKKNICDFLAMLFLRNQIKKNDSRDIVEGTLDKIYGKKIPDDFKLTCTEEYFTLFRMQTILNFGFISELISRMKFIVFENNTRVSFWTSDNPISRENEFDNAPFRNLGFVNSGIERYLPLTPKLTLGFVDPVHFKEIDFNYLVCTPNGVLRQNFLQLDSSNRFIFSNTKKFPRAIEMLGTHPYYCEVNRPRFEFIKQGTSKQTLIHNMERNFKFNVEPNKPIMNKLNTWLDFNEIEKLKTKHKISWSN